MITNTEITLYHAGYDPVTRDDCYTRTYYARASLQEDVKVSVLDNGLKSANVVKIRVPTADDMVISNGDKIIARRCDDEIPPDGAYTVIGYADNRKGSRQMWHWKVVCT